MIFNPTCFLSDVPKDMEICWSFTGIIVTVLYFLVLAATNTSIIVAAAANNETDHLALLEFKAKITADPLRVLSSWSGSTHFCNWHGVTCSRRHHQRVTILDLSHSKLAGSISPHIGNMSFLNEVYLQNNSFTGHIPPQFGSLRRLEQLLVSNNLLQGTVPANISACSHLILFAAGHNNLGGEIPVELGSFPKLLHLSFGYNNLTGNIPPSFTNLSSLESLYLNDNYLVGRIPNDLSLLTNLTTFALGGNRLSSTIPPSLLNLSSITELDLGDNQFLGTLPSSLFNNLPNLQFFGISNNQFTGPMPISISNASNLQTFQVGRNKLDGKVPSLEKLHMLQVFRLTINNFGTGGSKDDLAFLCSLTNATSLLFLVLNVNNFGGALPQCISNLPSTLTNLWLDNNKISGSIPIGIGNLVNLERLDFWNNKLSGGIPPEIGNLHKMQEFSLSENNISGEIPSSLGNLKVLSKLYMYSNNLQGSIPSNLSQCKNLLLLNLRNNNLSGSIPPDVIGISSLSIGLSFAGNQLSGVIPKEVANLENIGILDLSENMLSGEIPDALSSCVKLETLILGGNSLQGNIPSSLSSLRGIIYMNFSHNNLSGQIPKFLESFGSLESLDLSYNNFQGIVPMEGVFKNASATSFEGNNELCGGLADFHLPKCKSKKSISTLVVVLVVTSISMLLLIMFLISILLFCCFKKKRTVSTIGSSRNLLAKVSYQDLLEATDDFSSANMIGRGSFGSVYKGVLNRVGTVLAVKVLNLLRPGALKSFIAECEALRNIRHRNLVKVISACSGVDHNGNDFKALVYEFMVNGSLDEWLHSDSRATNANKATRELSFLQRVNILIDVANALDYLHCHHQESPIVHCDLKPNNVLLDEEMIGHVGDFGLARFLGEVEDMETSSIAIKGTIGYTAPEYGMGSKLSTNGDVYSYGILVLEVFTGKRPTDDMFQGDLNLHSFVKEAMPDRVIEISYPTLLQEADGEMCTKFVDCLVSVFGVGVACSAELPLERLRIGDAATQLSSLRDKLLAIQNDKTMNYAGNVRS